MQVEAATAFAINLMRSREEIDLFKFCDDNLQLDNYLVEVVLQKLWHNKFVKSFDLFTVNSLKLLEIQRVFTKQIILFVRVLIILQSIFEQVDV